MSENNVEQYHQGIVIYTDGGARDGNPGKMGWGVHGYRYTKEPAKQGTGLATHMVTTRGYIENHRKNEKGYEIVQPLEYFDFFGSSLVRGTNNAAEVSALFRALEKFKTYNISTIQVFTDSEYLRKGLEEYVHTWKARNWTRQDGTPVPNAALWQELLREIDVVRAMGIEIAVDWVKGHQNFGNIIADKWATVGVMYSMDNIGRSDFKCSPSKGYWKSDVNRHPLLNFKRLYFNSAREYNTQGHYYIAEPGTASGTDEFVIGKKMPESSYAVLKLKEVDPIIEMVRQHQCQVANDINSVIMLRLDKVFAPDVYPFIEDHQQYAITKSPRSRFSLNFVDDKPLTVELNPAGLSLRALECFSLLEELLQRFENAKAEIPDPTIKNTCFQIHDITSIFYETEVKPKTGKVEYRLKPEINVGLKDVLVTVKIGEGSCEHEIRVPLILGADLVPRNNLKRIETLEPKINLLTWKESKQSVRYACVIETVSGLGIWSNFFADRIFINN